MDLIQAVVFGLIQGVTEFLPVSSSGHLLLLPALFDWTDPGAGFTAVIQLGTLAAVLIYFWTDINVAFLGWARSLTNKSLRNTPESRMGWAIALGTVPIVVCGLLFQDQITSTFRSATLVAWALMVVSVVMLFAEWLSKKSLQYEGVRPSHGFWVGCFQALALVPGASRSGTTIAGGLFLGLDRATAARFSFLLSVPSVLLSGLYELYAEREALLGAGLAPTVVAALVAFVTGYGAIAFLIEFLKKRSIAAFVVYRVVLATIIIALVSTGRIAG